VILSSNGSASKHEEGNHRKDAGCTGRVHELAHRWRMPPSRATRVRHPSTLGHKALRAPHRGCSGGKEPCSTNEEDDEHARASVTSGTFIDLSHNDRRHAAGHQADGYVVQAGEEPVCPCTTLGWHPDVICLQRSRPCALEEQPEDAKYTVYGCRNDAWYSKWKDRRKGATYLRWKVGSVKRVAQRRPKEVDVLLHSEGGEHSRHDGQEDATHTLAVKSIDESLAELQKVHVSATFTG
jgi:hypothetical protein